MQRLKVIVLTEKQTKIFAEMLKTMLPSPPRTVKIITDGHGIIVFVYTLCLVTR